jgi:hypothetical protein
MADLHQFLERVSLLVEQEFQEEGTLEPTYVVITSTGVLMVPMPTVSDKNFAIFLIKKLFEDLKPIAYVFYDEAWTWEGPEIEVPMNKDISQHPDRKEIVHLAGEDYVSGFILASRTITRIEGKVKLGPLTIANEHSVLEGRMVGLLPPKGRMN